MDAYAGVTADQIAAQQIGQDSLLPSLELATEDHSGLIGACDRDYGCIYMNTLSWRTPTTPMPMEINPRKVFERMFGQGGTEATSAFARRKNRSILDQSQKRRGPAENAGRKDRRWSERLSWKACAKSNAAFRSGSQQATPTWTSRIAPGRNPYSFEEHIKLMYDLLALAYQANITRVFHVHGGARGEQQDVSAGRRARRAPRHVASSEPAGKDREAGEDPDVSHRAVRAVP